MPAVRREKIVTTTVRFEDGLEIQVTFDRNRLTIAWANSVDADESALAGALADVITSWDVTHEDGTPLEVTANTIASNFDVWDLRDLAGQIGEAARPSRAEGNDSSELSSIPSMDSEQLQQMPPNGQQTSPSQTPSVSPSPT